MQEDQLPSWKSVSLEGSLTCRCSEPGSQGHNYLGGRFFVFEFYMISKVLLAHWAGKVCSLIKTAQTSDELLMPSRTWTTDGLVGEGVWYASLDLISRTHIKVKENKVVIGPIHVHHGAHEHTNSTRYIHNKIWTLISPFLLGNFHTTAVT